MIGVRVTMIRLQKAVHGAFSVAFFFFLCQAARVLVEIFIPSSVVCNGSAAFGVHVPSEIGVIIGIASTIFFIAGWIFMGNEPRWEWPWIFLIAAGFSNLAERLFFGCVVDYIHISAFPVFNVADVLLTVGTVSLFLFFPRFSENDKM